MLYIDFGCGDQSSSIFGYYKGTKCWVESSFQEYSETDVLQMVGRAGRPQFERDGVAVIMTSIKFKHRYERIIEGTEKIESSLHMNFREHLAAEISVGVIKTSRMH